jgi:hypothetical protein
LPYTQAQSAHPHGEVQEHDSGAFAHSHDFVAAQLSPQHDEQQPDEKIAIPAETMPAANRLSAEFFMHPL